MAVRSTATFPAQTTLALVGVAAALFLAGCSQVKYAKIEVSDFDGDKPIASRVIKRVVVATHQEEAVVLTERNGKLYLDAWKDSEDSEVISYSTNPQNGQTVEWLTVASGSSFPSNVELRVRVRGQKESTFLSQRIVESGTTWKIGSWLL